MSTIMYKDIAYGGGGGGSSDVVPNPAGTPLFDLNTIGINNIIYNIPSGGSSDVSNLDDLDDVNISSPVDGQVLKYNNGTWVNANESGGGGTVTDVQIDSTSIVSSGIANITTMTGAGSSAAGTKGLVPAPASGDNTKFLRGDGTWQSTGSSNVSVLNDLSDVSTTGATSGQVLTYNGTSWEGATPSSGTVTDVKVDNVSVVTSGIANINTMTGADGSAAGSKGLVPAPASTDNDKFLKGDGTWATPSGGGGSSTLAGLSDVDVQTTTPTDGQVLTYDYANSKWVNEDPSGDEAIVLTKAQYNALTPAQQTDITKTYYITDEPSDISGLNAIVDTLYSGRIDSTGTYNLTGSIDDYDMLIVGGFNYMSSNDDEQFISITIMKNDYYIAGPSQANLGFRFALCGYQTRRIVFYFPDSTHLEVGSVSTGGINRVYGIKFLNQNVYSTAEQRIGTWIDGKPLYQKTVEINSIDMGETYAMSLGISNIDNIMIDMAGSFLYKDSQSTAIWTLPNVHHNAVNIVGVWFSKDTGYVNFRIGSSSRGVVSGAITVRYTKTTN